MKNLLLLFLVFFLCIPFFSSAQIPKTLSYQGMLTDTDGTALADDDYSIRFRLYNQESGGTAVWEETQNVTLEGGIFNVILGSVMDLDIPFDQPYWLGLTVGDSEEMSPRVELTAAAYSLGGDFNSLSNIPENIDLDKTDDFDGNYNSLSGAPTNVSSFTNDAGYLTGEADGSDSNELQVLSISNDTIFLSNGGYVKLPEGFDGNYSSLSGAPTNVSEFTNDAGYLTMEQDSSPVNEIQTLDVAQLNGTVLELSLSDDGEDTKMIDLTSLQTAGSEVQAAENVIISDTAGFYEGSNVEQALNELGKSKARNDSILLVGIDSANTVIQGPTAIAEFQGTPGREDIIQVLHRGSKTGIASYVFGTANGTIDAPLAVSPNERLSGVLATGYTDTQFGYASGIYFESDGIGKDNKLPGKIVLATSDTGAVMAPRMVINSLGNVGIGTTTPYPFASLNIINNNKKTDGIVIQTNDPEGVSRIDFVNNNLSNAEIGINGSAHPNYPNALYLHQFGKDAIKFGTDNTTRMVIDGDGNVGIGTETPQAKLHVLENDTNSIVRIESPGPSYEARLEFKKYGTLGDAAVGFYPGNADLRFRTKDNTAFVFEHDETEHVRINPNGNVGIGTNNPYQKLVVNGNAVVKNLSLEHEGRGALFFAGTGDFGHAIYNNYFDLDGKGSFDGIHWNAGGGIKIRTFTMNDTPALFLRDDGNLAIGTDDPYQKLVVNGNAVVKNLSLEHEGRGALFFAGVNDFNHALYNDNNNIDGEGSFDGIKWNVGAGIEIHSGFDESRSLGLSMDGNNNFGLGTLPKDIRLTVNGNTFIQGDNDTGIGFVPPPTLDLAIDDNDSGIDVPSDGTLTLVTNGLERLRIDDSGYVGLGTNDPNYPLELASGAHVTTGGVWTNASSRSLKENIIDLSSQEAIGALEALKPVKYNYISEQDESYVGFIAEDVPEVVAMNDRKSLSSMDIVALLTKVVQEQQKSIESLSEELELLKKELEQK